MISSDSYIFTGKMTGSTLAYDNITCNYMLSAEHFNSETLTMRFATVL